MSNDKKEVLARLWTMWTMICKMIMDGTRDAHLVAKYMQRIIDPSLPIVDTVESAEKFKLVRKFSIVLPQDYNRHTHMNLFYERCRKEFFHCDPAIVSQDSSMDAMKLEPWRNLNVKVFEIKGNVTTEECLALLRSHQAVFVGTQGASLVFEQCKYQLPNNRWAVSFSGNDSPMSLIRRYSGGAAGIFCFELRRSEHPLNEEYCLLCFCNEPYFEF